MHIGRLQAGTAGEALGTKELEFADWEVRPRRARAASPRSGAPDSARDAPPGAPARQVCDLDDVEGDCDPRPRIVVLGSGWAAHAFVKARAPRRPLVVKGCFCKRSLHFMKINLTFCGARARAQSCLLFYLVSWEDDFESNWALQARALVSRPVPPRARDAALR